MIAANGVTARFLEANRVPALRRIVRSPERWARIVQLAGITRCGCRMRRIPKRWRTSCGKSALRAREFPVLSLAVLKLLGRGEYVAEVPGDSTPGHFGLAVEAYTHSTAPNRRFPDLVTQRLIKATLERRPLPYSASELVALAAHCTEQEDNANKVERAVRKSAAALLLEHRIGATFESVVAGASSKGTWVRIWHPRWKASWTSERKSIRWATASGCGSCTRTWSAASSTSNLAMGALSGPARSSAPSTRRRVPRRTASSCRRRRTKDSAAGAASEWCPGTGPAG